jgi:hypothetical protein
VNFYAEEPPTTKEKLRGGLLADVLNGTLTQSEREYVAEIVRSVTSMLDAEDNDPGMDLLVPLEVEASRWRVVSEQVRDVLRRYYTEELS